MSGTSAIASMLGSGMRLLLDAALDWHPATLAMRAPRVHSVQYLNDLLAHHGVDERRRAARARTLRIDARRPPSSNCINRVLEVDWAQGEGMPRTLFLKLPGEPAGTRFFCNLIGAWELEAGFFRAFSGDFPLRIPAVHAVATHRSRFALLQEDLAADPSVTLHTNRDMQQGVSPELARRCLAGFAVMHARYHGLDAEARERLLPMARHPFLSPRMSAISRFINVAAIGPCRKKAPALFTEERARAFRGAMQRWPLLQAWWYSGPLTLVHGDSHIGNVFLDGERTGLIDFQAPHWSKGLRDVQYFLGNSMDAAVLARHEDSLLAFYLDRLGAHGVRLGADEAFAQYRAFSFQTLMTIVTSLGLGPLTEQDRLMHEVLARALASVERLGFYPWLERLAAGGEGR